MLNASPLFLIPYAGVPSYPAYISAGPAPSPKEQGFLWERNLWSFLREFRGAVRTFPLPLSGGRCFWGDRLWGRFAADDRRALTTSLHRLRCRNQLVAQTRRFLRQRFLQTQPIRRLVSLLAGTYVLLTVL